MESPQSPFAWPGGKRALKTRLLALIPEHRVYVEVFAGSAKLLFAKPPSEREVMNDLNGEVTNFFRVAKHRPSELAEMFDHELVHAGRFKDLRGEVAQPDELHRALRFAYLAWYSYGAKGEHFASSSADGCTGNKLRRSLDRVRDLLDQTAVRLYLKFARRARLASTDADSVDIQRERIDKARRRTDGLGRQLQTMRRILEQIQRGNTELERLRTRQENGIVRV